ncbi:hypothetical protein [Acetomicrobium sp.]|uniref:hypothetical protein n=1 Tax=Acetomicrobium sp. TaxID=1872099 RepID=UPI001BD0B11E|nr:hypothetical protein [Acetomicrobium sp.]
MRNFSGQGFSSAPCIVLDVVLFYCLIQRVARVKAGTGCGRHVHGRRYAPVSVELLAVHVACDGITTNDIRPTWIQLLLVVPLAQHVTEYV